MERNARLRLQVAAASVLTATREDQLANAAYLLFGRTSSSNIRDAVEVNMVDLKAATQHER
jgi:hypothetical protein